MTDRTRRLAALSRAVAEGGIAPEDVRQLARDIAELAAAVEPGDPARPWLRDLALATRQLDKLVQRTGAPLDPRSLAGLPPVLGRTVTARLTNAVTRLDRLSANQASARPPGRATLRAGRRRTPDPSFQCAQDFRACMARSRSPSSRFWCHVAMLVCLARTVVPMIERASRGG